MKYIIFCLSFFILFFTSTSESKAFTPKDRAIGMGIIIGEPTGLSAKYWTSKNNAFVFGLGNSYLGTLRIGVDYILHFNAFNSKIVSLFTGPGIAIGIGRSSGWLYNNNGRTWYRNDDNIGLGSRAVSGLNINPQKYPIELFGELCVLVGFNPEVYTNVEVAFGFRYYFASE